MMNVIGYIRVSTREQGHKHSLDSQKSKIESFCLVEGWNLIKIISECESGTTMHRRGIAELNTYIQNQSIDGLVIWKLDRLSRSLIDGKLFITTLDQKSIFLKSISEQLIDTSTPLGAMIMNLLLTFSEFERSLMNERVMAGKEKAFRKGYRSQGRIPFGYKVTSAGELIPHLEEAPFIKRIFKMRNNGFSYRLICQKVCQELKDVGIETGPTTHVSISKILKNRTYLGEVQYHGHWKIGVHDPLISKISFNRIN
jgi:site-specific DNA recombinase